MKRSTLYYYLSVVFTILLPSVYILYAFGVFEEGIITTRTSWSMGLYIAFVFMVYQIISTFQRKANDYDNPNKFHRALGTGLAHARPWLLLLIITVLVHLGVAQIVQHISIIAGLELLGSCCIGKQKYWMLKEREPND